MIKVAVVGATGYAGGELVRILAGHPEVALTVLSSRKYAGMAFDQVFPAFSGMIDKVCVAYDKDEVCQQADVIFTALPHAVSMSLVPEMVAAGKKVIDLSADFRFQDAAVYESHYQAHSASHLLGEAVYGLAEVYTQQIAAARLIGNPGCYPTSVLLPLVPLLKEGLISMEGIVADSKSGVSGAGRAPSLTVHYCEVTESFSAYKMASHRHNPEMEAIAAEAAGQSVALTFVPHLLPMSRGMLSTIYTRMQPGISSEQVASCLGDYYAQKAFVRLRGAGTSPNTRHVRGTNCCDIGFVIDARTGQLILISAIDNLVKGAAGQAVQNMNLMFSLDEKTGLQMIPGPV